MLSLGAHHIRGAAVRPTHSFLSLSASEFTTFSPRFFDMTDRDRTLLKLELRLFGLNAEGPWNLSANRRGVADSRSVGDRPVFLADDDADVL